ncbi:MAG: MerR family transcriptional regulator [Planctomycetota bacterium]|jgi:DNA-binding transcriptional MerR regulator/methylmalonyl-CoA mutase cobalamin-binding subunit
MSGSSDRKPHQPLEGEFSIGDVAKATGIGPDTIRAWERKYGRPQPDRLPSGHRRYSEQDVRWLRRVAEALARGHRAGVAVGATESELAELLREDPAAPDPEIAGLLDRVRAYRRRELIEHLRGTWQAQEPEPFLERVAVLARAVGRAWADGTLDVRHEHFLSNVLGDFLRTCRQDFPTQGGDPIVVLATLSGEKHGLGLQMAAVVCAWKRFTVHFLGTETPVVELVRSARELESAAVAIGVSLASGGVETDRLLSELRRGLPDGTALLVGGAGARRGRWGARGTVYLKTLHDLANWLDGRRADAGGTEKAG